MRNASDGTDLEAQTAHRLRRAKRNLVVARPDVGRVLVVDDSASFRQVAASVLSATSRLRPFGAAESGEEALRLLPDLRPDLVLLDVNMPGLAGVETARAIHRASPTTAVILMSADSSGLAEAGRAARAVAVLDKADLSPHTLDELWLKHRSERRD